MVPTSEMIYLESLIEAVDYVWDGAAMLNEPPSGVVWVHNDNIANFFRKYRSKRYIVVSGNSDFSLHYQAEHHPNTDLRRLSNYLPWQKAAEVRDQYASIQVGPACNPKECDARDRYSLKTYCFTKSTFPAIPDNIVHWFVANTNIHNDPRIEWMPYGMNPQHGPPRAKSGTKSSLLYVNFQNFTDERTALNDYYRTRSWVTQPPAGSLPLERYWQDIADHKFVLCPNGNGLDCFRTYEVFYLGSIPVMRNIPFAYNFVRHGLPIVMVDSLFELTPEFLEHKWRQVQHCTFEYEAIKLSFWKERIQTLRSKL